MKKWLIISICWLITTAYARAQDFITRGKIEYEIKKNNKKIYSDAQRANSTWIASLPEFDIFYRELVFSWNHLLYLPGRKGTLTAQVGDNTLFTDLDTRKTISKQTHISEAYIIEDSVRPVKWKIENEIRKIAGFECRKAIGRIHDSVYVVAFYCPEIIPQGGPEFFSGLPGMILGLAIPRYYTTWFATKIELASLDESTIVPPTLKKNKQYNKKELADILYKKYKEAGWWKGVTPAKVLTDLDDYTF
jgi:GLPGLI family protein